MISDRELVELLEQRTLGIAAFGTCGICRQVAELALATIAEHRASREARRAAVRAEAASAIDECADLARVCGCDSLGAEC